MKDWDELTIEELAALTDAQVETYKKWLCAQNGIKFPIKPKEPNIIDIPRNLTVYSIELLSNEIYFSSFEEAVTVSNFLKNCTSIGHYEYDKRYTDRYFVNGTPRDYSGNNRQFEVSAVNMYSEDKFLEVQENLDIINRLKEQYDKDKREYEDTKYKAIEVTQDFLDKLDEAKETIARRNNLTFKYYNDYLPLAENNSDIAMSFLKKAYHLDDDDKAYILSHKVEECNPINV